MRDSALVLTEDKVSRQTQCLRAVLRFFGVPSRTLPAAQVMMADQQIGSISGRVRILSSAEAFLQLIEQSKRNPYCSEWWTECVHSAFIYSNDDSYALQKLVRVLTGDDRAVVSQTTSD